MTHRISLTLIGRRTGAGTEVCCSECGHVVAPAGTDKHWKDLAVLTSQPVRGLPGWADSVHPDLVLRRFACAGCGQLLDSETALEEDPFLYDVIDG